MSKKVEALQMAKQIFETENQLNALKAQLSELQKEFEAFFEGREKNAPEASPSIAERVKHHFAHSPDQVFTVKDLNSMIPDAQDETLRVTLSRLANQAFIHSVERGKYTLNKNLRTEAIDSF